MKLIVTYPGFDPALEEELYFASRVRPVQAGQQPVEATFEPDSNLIHNPKAAQQHQRVLTYVLPSKAGADALAVILKGAHGFAAAKASVKVIDDRKVKQKFADALADLRKAKGKSDVKTKFGRALADLHSGVIAYKHEARV